MQVIQCLIANKSLTPGQFFSVNNTSQSDYTLECPGELLKSQCLHSTFSAYTECLWVGPKHQYFLKLLCDHSVGGRDEIQSQQVGRVVPQGSWKHLVSLVRQSFRWWQRESERPKVENVGGAETNAWLHAKPQIQYLSVCDGGGHRKKQSPLLPSEPGRTWALKSALS